MKQTMKNLMTLVATALMATTMWAEQTVNITVTNTAGGTLTSSVAETNGLCTLTATPSAGYYITASDITVEKVVSGNVAQSRRRAPGVSGTIELAASGDNTDPSGVTTYTFTMPSADYDVLVTATFQQRTSITDDMVTLSATEFTYTGRVNAPDVTVVNGEVTLTANTDYELVNEGGTDVGEYTVTVTGKNTYMGTVTKNFNIVAAAATITAKDTTVTYNREAQVFEATTDKGTIAIEYYATAADRTNGTNKLTAEPINAGIYYILVKQTDANYAAAAVNATMTIEKATIASLILADEVLTCTDAPQTVAVEAVLTEEELDLREGEYTVSGNTQTAVGTYVVTVTAAENSNFQGSATAEFSIVRQLSINFAGSNEWATYCAAEDLNVPEGLTAFVVTEIGTSSVTTAPIDYLPAGQAVLLQREAGYVEAQDYAADAYTGEKQETITNLLMGTAAATDIESLSGGKVYVLFNDEFVRSIAGTIPANRGYLLIGSGVNPARRLSITYDEETLGIESVANATNNALLKNGWYTLDGRKLQGAPSVKGLYINNGRKLVVK